MTAYIYNNLRVILLKIRNISFAEQINSRILKSDCIHHTAVNFCHTRGRITSPWHISYTFCRDSSQFIRNQMFQMLL